MKKTWCVYVIETDVSELSKYKGKELKKPTVYVGSTSLTAKERFKQHKERSNRPMKARHGKPIRLLDEFYVDSINSAKLANDIERLIWNKLRTSGKYIVVQKYAPSMYGRTDYIDNYPNYKKDN